MLIKILFTLAVIIVVILVFRNKRAPKISRPAEQSPEQSPEQYPEQASTGALSTRIVAYIILGILVAISVTVFVVNYQHENQIITIRVVAENGMSTVYQAKQKSIKGRNFVTLDGRQIALGDGDRVEIDSMAAPP